ncbi:hypothetical protein EP342_03960 [bacterium]|nr:MAG: hypothetical protein EP342_03960 [bacterium]
MAELLYREVQTFRQKFLWIFLITICGGSIILFSIALYKQVIMNVQFGDKPMSDTSLVIGLLLVICFGVFLLWFFYRIRLEFEIYQDTIRYKFWPFIRQEKVIPISNIYSINVEKYKPIREYGGWGYRFSMKGRGLCLNVSKNIGLRIKMKDGFELLLGTQQETELSRVVQQIKEIDLIKK